MPEPATHDAQHEAYCLAEAFRRECLLAYYEQLDTEDLLLNLRCASGAEREVLTEVLEGRSVNYVCTDCETPIKATADPDPLCEPCKAHRAERMADGLTVYGSERLLAVNGSLNDLTWGQSCEIFRGMTTQGIRAAATKSDSGNWPGMVWRGAVHVLTQRLLYPETNRPAPDPVPACRDGEAAEMTDKQTCNSPTCQVLDWNN